MTVSWLHMGTLLHASKSQRDCYIKSYTNFIYYEKWNCCVGETFVCTLPVHPNKTFCPIKSLIYCTPLFLLCISVGTQKYHWVHQLMNQLSCSVMSDSLQLHGLQPSRFPCPSPTPGACSSSCPLMSVMPSSHLILCNPLLLLPQSLSASGSFSMSQFFISDGQSSRA